MEKSDMTIAEFIDTYDPCVDGADWLVTQSSLAEAWNNCDYTDWLLWAAMQVGIEPSVFVGLACDFAEHTLSILEKSCPNDRWHRTALAQARKGPVSLDIMESVDKSIIEYKDIPSAAHSARAAYFVSRCSQVTDIGNVNYYATYAAAHSAYATGDGYNQEVAWQCDRIRQVISNPFKE